MLRLDNRQQDLLTAMLPAEVLRLPPELAEVDRMLDDPQVLAPLAGRLCLDRGRPSLPVAQVLRLFYLNERYQLSDRALVTEVSDSFHWRRFCHMSLSEAVPHPTSLTVWRRRLGTAGIQAVNAAVVARLQADKVVRGRKFRIDSTVVEANIHYPSDAHLVADGMRVVTRLGRRIRAMLGDGVRKMVDRRRGVQRRLLAIGKHLQRRTGEAYAQVRRISGELADVAQAQIRAVQRVLTGAKDMAASAADSMRAAVQRMVAKTEAAVATLARIVDQTRQVNAGVHHIPDRVVSVADPDARPIVKGKLGQSVQFGYKVQIIEAEGGYVTDYTVDQGNPPDTAALVPALERHKRRFGREPTVVATDRGYDSRENQEACRARGIRTVAIPKRGKSSQARRALERSAAFRRAQRWRAGGEATISRLKRKYGLRRTRYRGQEAVAAGVGLGILAHNLRRWAVAGA